MANKTKTIKNASDSELNDLLIRLRKESELQSLIGQIKLKAITKKSSDPYSEEARRLLDGISTEIPIEDLYHYGIAGMRWGVRKGSSGGSRKGYKPRPADVRKAIGKGAQAIRKSLDKNKSPDYLETKKLRKKKVKQLSNEELKKLNNRLQLERQYKQLTNKNTKRGKKILTDALGSIGKQAVNAAVKGFAEKMASDFASRYGPGATPSPSRDVIDLKFIKD